jgi:hypothetical protein
LAAYNRALCLREDDADLLLNIGRLHMTMQHRELAKSYFRKSVEVDGNAYALDGLRLLELPSATPDVLSKNDAVGRIANLLEEPRMPDLPSATSDTLPTGEAVDANAQTLEPLPTLDLHANSPGADSNGDPTPPPEYEIIRNSALFNSAWYLEVNPDVRAAGLDAISHYMTNGLYEGRPPCPLFDPLWYLAQYKDVARSRTDPLAHYIQFGAVEGRDPSPYFNSSWYLESYPDIKADGINPLLHFLTLGQAEGRLPTSAGGDGTPPFEDWRRHHQEAQGAV